MVFFCHIHRSAGSSTHVMLHKCFLDPEHERIHIVSGNGQLPKVSEAIRRLPDRHFYIGGHVGLHELADYGINVEPCDLVFSCLRDPVERAVSLYFLYKRSPSWFPTSEPNLADRGFEYFYEYLRDQQLFFNNDQCQLIANNRDFAATLRVVLDRFSILGSYAYMDEFHKELARQMRKIAPDFVPTAPWINAAFHEQTREKWKKRKPVTDVVNSKMARKILQDSESDQQLLEFIEDTHKGIYLTESLVSR